MNSDDVFAIPLSRLSAHEKARMEAAGSSHNDPYVVIRRKTRAVARLLNVDEATAEAIVLGRVDATIQEG